MLVIQAVPQVVIAMLAMFIFAIGLKWFPTGYAYTAGTMPDWTSWAFIKDVGYHAILPLVCASIVQIGGFLVNMRNNMINLLAEDYITMPPFIQVHIKFQVFPIEYLQPLCCGHHIINPHYSDANYYMIYKSYCNHESL